MMITPFERSYWVIPGKFMAGKYPASREKNKTLVKLDNLLSVGIRTIIDMTEEEEANIYNDPLFQYHDYLLGLAGQKNFKINRKRIPIPAYNVPTMEEAKQIIDLIDEGVKNSSPVYLHCRGGMGRTGMMVGCYLLSKGMANKENIFPMIDYLKRTTDVHDLNSPAVKAQIEFIKNWKD